MGESIMKKTMITALVAVAAFGISSTSFAWGGSSSSSSGLIDIEDVNVAVDLSETITETTNINKTINKWGVEADFKAPAAGGDIGQVAYEAPAVGGDLIEISARAVAIQRGQVAPVYADLAFMGSGGAIAGSGEAAAAAAAAASSDASSDAAAAAGLAASSAAAADAAAGSAAGGDSGYVSFSGITTGAVSTGPVTIDLSNAATALAVGGGYTPVVTP